MWWRNDGKITSFTPFPTSVQSRCHCLSHSCILSAELTSFLSLGCLCVWRSSPPSNPRSERSLTASQDPEHSLTEYIHHLEMIQQRLGGMPPGNPSSVFACDPRDSGAVSRGGGWDAAWSALSVSVLLTSRRWSTRRRVGSAGTWGLGRGEGHTTWGLQAQAPDGPPGLRLTRPSRRVHRVSSVQFLIPHSLNYCASWLLFLFSPKIRLMQWKCLEIVKFLLKDVKPSNGLLPHFSLCSESTSKKSCCQKIKQWIKSCDNFEEDIWFSEGSLCCGVLSASPVSSVKCSHPYILLRSQMGYFLCNSAHCSFSSWWGSPLVLFRSCLHAYLHRG